MWTFVFIYVTTCLRVPGIKINMLLGNALKHVQFINFINITIQILAFIYDVAWLRTPVFYNIISPLM